METKPLNATNTMPIIFLRPTLKSVGLASILATNNYICPTVGWGFISFFHESMSYKPNASFLHDGQGKEVNVPCYD
jgi:hypothetical protein